MDDDQVNVGEEDRSSEANDEHNARDDDQIGAVEKGGRSL